MAKGELSPENTMMSFAIPKKLKEEFGMVATKENRSMSKMLCILIEHYILIHKSPEFFIAYYELISKAKSGNNVTM